MSFEKLLLDKYPIIEKVAMDRSLLVLDVTNLTSFNLSISTPHHYHFTCDYQKQSLNILRKSLNLTES